MSLSKIPTLKAIKKALHFRHRHIAIRKGRAYSYVAVPPFLVYNTHFIRLITVSSDRTRSHSELVFICFPIRYSHHIISLSAKVPHITRLINVLYISYKCIASYHYSILNRIVKLFFLGKHLKLLFKFIKLSRKLTSHYYFKDIILIINMT